MRKSLLAKVTLNWENLFEVRYFRINLRPNGTLWFQPPALSNSGWSKCFVVMKVRDWYTLNKKVIQKFLATLKEDGSFSKEYIKKLEQANKEERTGM